MVYLFPHPSIRQTREAWARQQARDALDARRQALKHAEQLRRRAAAAAAHLRTRALANRAARRLAQVRVQAEPRL